ncbi:MAG: ComF family protein [Acidiphilium sp.]|nr:ComF family protein [Acidiphilium sp.]MDD4934244.1 ComF family protein [Acidiphilium sp.]
MLRSLARATLNILLPAQCLSCTEPAAGAGQLCVTCFAGTEFITAPFCGHCGLPLAEPAPLCTACDWDPPSFRAARAAMRYGPAAKRLILPFKYADRPEAAAGLARLLLRPGAELIARADVLVPVPLHKRRLAARGYNQAGQLARALGKLAARPVLIDGLIRTRATRPLAELDQHDREVALRGAIAVRPGRAAAIIGRTILLIDDVLTSGATASSCAITLYEAGAAAVDVLALARVADHHES